MKFWKAVKTCSDSIVENVKAATEIVREGVVLLKHEDIEEINPSTGSSTRKDIEKVSTKRISTWYFNENKLMNVAVSDKNEERNNDTLIGKLKNYVGNKKNSYYFDKIDKSVTNGARSDKKEDDNNKTDNGNIAKVQDKYIKENFVLGSNQQVEEVTKNLDKKQNYIKECTSSLVQTNFITEESNKENKKKEVYSLASLNYYWPLDPSHLLHKEEFKQKLKIRKERYNPWKQTNTNYKKIHIHSKSKEEEENTRKATKWKKTHIDKINISTEFYSQTKEQYTHQIKSGEYYPTMSELKKRTPKAPLLHTSFHIQNRGGGVVDEDGWTTQGAKKIEKKKDMHYGLTSDIYLPTKYQKEFKKLAL
jgi:hypothetical protein